MARGRRPKPTVLKRLAGNPGKRAMNEGEPTPEAVLPDPPSSLGELGQAKWREVALKLYNQGILTELDIDLLWLYCLNFEQFTAAEAKVTAFGGPVISSPKG